MVITLVLFILAASPAPEFLQPSLSPGTESPPGEATDTAPPTERLPVGAETYLELRNHSLLSGKIAARRGDLLFIDRSDGTRVLLREGEIRRAYDFRSSVWRSLNNPLSATLDSTVSSQSAGVEPETKRKSIVSIAPIPLTPSTPVVEIEGAASRFLTLYAGGMYNPFISGYVAQAGTRIYIVGAAPIGLFADLHGNANGYDSPAAAYEFTGGGLLLGYTAALGDSDFVASGGAGADVGGYSSRISTAHAGMACGSWICLPTVNVSTTESSGMTVVPTLRMMIGYRF